MARKRITPTTEITAPCETEAPRPQLAFLLRSPRRSSRTWSGRCARIFSRGVRLRTSSCAISSPWNASAAGSNGGLPRSCASVRVGNSNWPVSKRIPRPTWKRSAVSHSPGRKILRSGETDFRFEREQLKKLRQFVDQILAARTLANRSAPPKTDGQGQPATASADNDPAQPNGPTVADLDAAYRRMHEKLATATRIAKGLETTASGSTRSKVWPSWSPPTANGSRQGAPPTPPRRSDANPVDHALPSEAPDLSASGTPGARLPQAERPPVGLRRPSGPESPPVPCLFPRDTACHSALGLITMWIRSSVIGSLAGLRAGRARSALSSRS